MFCIRTVDSSERKIINQVVKLHRLSFEGFFLSSMNTGFLRTLYMSFCEHQNSNLLVILEDEVPVAFLAYSWNTSGVYSFMIKKHLLRFMWYSFLAFLRRPSIFTKMFRALKMPAESKRDESYVKIFSIGVHPDYRNRGYGSILLDELKHRINLSGFDYITLETDADNNEGANTFYKKNGLVLSSIYVTPEGRKMNKYHYRNKHEHSIS